MRHAKHLLFCLGLIGIAGIMYLTIPGVRGAGVLGIVILACPLMHIFMMKDMHKKDSHH